MFQFNHCISQHFWFIFLYHTETQVRYTPSLRKGKWYFGSPVPPTPPLNKAFEVHQSQNRSQNTLAWGQEGLESLRLGDIWGVFWGQVALSASPLPPAAHEDTLPRAAGMSAPTMDISRHFLSLFVVASKVADLQALPKFSSSSLLWLRQLLFVPSHLSAIPVHLHEPTVTAAPGTGLYSLSPQTKELLPVFCAVEGFIFMLHKTKQMLWHTIWPKTQFFCFASTD